MIRHQTMVSRVESIASPLTTGNIRVALDSRRNAGCIAPTISGRRMVRRSGFASDQVLMVTPLMSSGAINGIKITVPTATNGMRAPAKPMSPRAFPTIC